MPWAVWTECVICSEVPWLYHELVSVQCIEELIKLPNSECNTDGAAGFLSGQKVWGLLQCFGNGRRVYNFLSGQKVWAPLQCFGNGRRVHNYLRGQKVLGLLHCYGNGRRVYNYLRGQKARGLLQYSGNGHFKLQVESVIFRVTKPVQHRSQFSTSEQMSQSCRSACALVAPIAPL